MKTNVIRTIGLGVTKVLSKAKFKAIKVMPDGLMVIGVAGFVGTCVLVAKGTKKYEEIKGDNGESRAEKAKKAVVCFAPAGIAGGLTVGCFTGGHYILKKRNVALVAAYKAVDDSFKKYRGAVVEKYGEDEDARLKNGLRVEKETVTEIGEDGKKKKVKKEVEYLDGDVSGYSFIYDNDHYIGTIWSAITARDQLKIAENSANVLLQARGYITLNEVLMSIGLNPTSAGQIVGWQTKGTGDGYVDFRARQIRSEKDEGGAAFILDFNVDGPIYQDIDRYTRRWEE